MRRAAAAAIACVLLAAGCGPRRVSGPGANGPTLVVVLADPQTTQVGVVSVESPKGTVELSTARAATTVRAGRAPTRVQPLADDVYARLFAETVSSLPLAPLSFTLYFRLDSNELTEESRVMLPGVLKAVAMYPAPEVAVVGHTDTSGDAKANYTLGLERATTVRTLLTGVGVDPALIEVSSHGESDLLVPTPDETYEPRNRRVEISVR
jgi:outer membrane protein OmpA-like peptidoglycan-associated protein